MGPRVAEIWVSTGKAENRLRWESIKGVQIVREAEGISWMGPSTVGQTIMVCPDREMPTQQVVPKLSREPNDC
jgi:hypothetical protein